MAEKQGQTLIVQTHFFPSFSELFKNSSHVKKTQLVYYSSGKNILNWHISVSTIPNTVKVLLLIKNRVFKIESQYKNNKIFF